MPGIFKGKSMKDAGQATEGGLYFPPGDRFIVEIQKCRDFVSRDGQPYFIVEAKVLHAENKKLNVGQVPSWMVPVPGKDSMGLKNINTFLREITGIDVTDEGVTDAQAAEAGEYIISEDQPLAGLVCVAETLNIKVGDKKDRDFTKINWSLPKDADYATVGRPKPADAAA